MAHKVFAFDHLEDARLCAGVEFLALLLVAPSGEQGGRFDSNIICAVESKSWGGRVMKLWREFEGRNYGEKRRSTFSCIRLQYVYVRTYVRTTQQKRSLRDFVSPSPLSLSLS